MDDEPAATHGFRRRTPTIAAALRSTTRPTRGSRACTPHLPAVPAPTATARLVRAAGVAPAGARRCGADQRPRQPSESTPSNMILTISRFTRLLPPTGHGARPHAMPCSAHAPSRSACPALLLAARRPARAQATAAPAWQPTAQDHADVARIEAYLDNLRTLKAHFSSAPDGGITQGTACSSAPAGCASSTTRRRRSCWSPRTACWCSAIQNSTRPATCRCRRPRSASCWPTRSRCRATSR